MIAKTKLCTEIHVQCNYKYTSSLKNCDIRWVLSSDLNLVILWQDLSLLQLWWRILLVSDLFFVHIKPHKFYKMVLVGWIKSSYIKTSNNRWLVSVHTEYLPSLTSDEYARNVYHIITECSKGMILPAVESQKESSKPATTLSPSPKVTQLSVPVCSFLSLNC